jgi:hypothetical protein
MIESKNHASRPGFNKFKRLYEIYLPQSGCHTGGGLTPTPGDRSETLFLIQSAVIRLADFVNPRGLPKECGRKK